MSAIAKLFNFEGAIYFIIFGIIVYFLLDAIIANIMEAAAADKGYDKRARVWLMCFFFGVIGYIYVAALPDKKQQEQNEIVIKQNQKIIRLLSVKESDDTTE